MTLKMMHLEMTFRAPFFFSAVVLYKRSELAKKPTTLLAFPTKKERSFAKHKVSFKATTSCLTRDVTHAHSTVKLVSF